MSPPTFRPYRAGADGGDDDDDRELEVRMPNAQRFELPSASSSTPPTPLFIPQSGPREYEYSNGASIQPFDAPSHRPSMDGGSPQTNPAAAVGGGATPSRNRSFLNLTTSTLFGICQPAGLATDTESPTPWSAGAQTPLFASRAGSVVDVLSRPTLPNTMLLRDDKLRQLQRRRRRSTAHQLPPRTIHDLSSSSSSSRRALPLLLRLFGLSACGALYGLLLAALHDRPGLAPVPLRVPLDNAQWWTYLLAWSVVGVALGELLPWADARWQSPSEHERTTEKAAVVAAEGEDEDSSDDGPDTGAHVDAIARQSPPHTQTQKRVSATDAWLDAARAAGALIGVAFAVRRLPWQSPLQLAGALACATPAVWYLLDRSAAGFVLAALVALFGTVGLFAAHPALIPASSPPLPPSHGYGNASASSPSFSADGLSAPSSLAFGLFRPESLAVAAWIASVLFVGCVCFGCVGRRLARWKAW